MPTSLVAKISRSEVRVPGKSLLLFVCFLFEGKAIVLYWASECPESLNPNFFVFQGLKLLLSFVLPPSVPINFADASGCVADAARIPPA